MKKLIFGISGGVSFLVFLILLTVTGHLGKTQDSQMMAERWGKKNAVQVSCFFSVNAGVTEDRIIEFEHTIDAALTDASVVQDSENPSARLWADAYSADGRLTLSNDRTSVEADAIGIGGDFFLFHPLKLLSGSYFSGNDLMQDYCIIDEDAAWQLFGSNNVAGMTVFIGGVPHIVMGVVERPEGRLQEAAGLDGTLVYVSYTTLKELGNSNGINHYEIIMPNPVTGFAEKFIRESLGTSEKETEVLENTSRYSFLSRLKLIPQFGTRSMNGKAIIYPYWENVARGYEDILAAVTLFQLLFLLYALLVGLVFFIGWWRHKGWTIKDKCLYVKDKAERLGERLRAKRLARKNNEDWQWEEEEKPWWKKGPKKASEKVPKKAVEKGSKKASGKVPKKAVEKESKKASEKVPKKEVEKTGTREPIEPTGQKPIEPIGGEPRESAENVENSKDPEEIEITGQTRDESIKGGDIS